MRRRRRSKKTVFVDTNLLLVLIVGALDPDHIARFKRTKAYSREDYKLLFEYVTGFQQLMTTPNVLTEVSNFLGQLAEPMRRKAFLRLRMLTGDLEEKYFPSQVLASDPHFPALGLSDTSITHSVDRSVTVLTDDLPLYLRLSTSGVEAVNFNHLRSGAWG